MLKSCLPKEFANPQLVLDQIEIEDTPEVVFKELKVGCVREYLEKAGIHWLIFPL